MEKLKKIIKIKNDKNFVYIFGFKTYFKLTYLAFIARMGDNKKYRKLV